MEKQTDIETIAGSIAGVQYATIYGNGLRVVFKHNTSTSAVERVSDALNCPGKLGATQEHLACADYPLDEIDA